MAGGETNLEKDPFVVGLLQRLPEDVRQTFTDDQLLGLKVALGARQWRRHAVDLRGTLGFWRWRWYYVVVAGRERRQLTRRQEALALKAKLLFLSGLVLFSLLLSLLLLYLLKSALGIDLVPGHSLGLWGWFKGTFF